jgi:hypothetical protein
MLLYHAVIYHTPHLTISLASNKHHMVFVAQSVGKLHDDSLRPTELRACYDQHYFHISTF